MMDMQEIPVFGIPAEETLPLLEAELSRADARLEVRADPDRLRGPAPDASILIAIISLGSAGISALITGLCRVLEKRQDRAAKIVLKGSDGATVEVPADISAHELERLVALAARLDRPAIRITTSVDQ